MKARLSVVPKGIGNAVSRITRFQELRWFFVESAGPAINIGFSLRIATQLNEQALRTAIQEVVRRHDILHCVYRKYNGHIYLEKRKSSGISLEIIDLSALSGADMLREAAAQGTAFFFKKFDLYNQGPFQATAFKLSSKDFILVASIDHNAADAASVQIVLKEIILIYASIMKNGRINLPAKALQFLDYATWERAPQQEKAFLLRGQYWDDQLRSGRRLRLPKSRHVERPDDKFTSSIFVFDEKMVGALSEARTRNATTLNILFLAAYSLVLSCWAREEDVIFASAASTRSDSALRDTVGPLLTRDRLRVSFAEDPTFAEIIRRVENSYVQAIKYRVPPTPGFMDLVSAYVNFTPAGKLNSQKAMSGVIEPFPLNKSRFEFRRVEPPVELTLYIKGEQSRIFGSFHYNSMLFEANDVDHLRDSFVRVLQWVCDGRAFKRTDVLDYFKG